MRTEVERAQHGFHEGVRPPFACLGHRRTAASRIELQGASEEGASGESMAAEGRTVWLKRLAPLIALAALALLVVALGGHRYLSLQAIADNRQALARLIEDHFLLALLLYVAAYVAAVALSLPGAVYLTLAGGFLFGWLVGGAAAVLGATVGATLIFLIARTSFGEPLAERAGPWLAKLRAGFQADALHYLLFLRLVPAFPFWLVNLAPALLGVPLRTFVIATAIGIVPATFAFAIAGAGLDSVLEAQRQAYEACLAAPVPPSQPCRFAIEPSTLVTRELIAAFAALGALALLPVVVKRWRNGSAS